jgi:tRNA (cmo5U34)-methyltransferase
VPDDDSKLELLSQTRQRLKPGAPLILVDQCMDRAAADFDTRLDRYASFARLSGVAPETVTMARNALSAHEGMVSADRNEELLKEAGFRNSEVFYVGMAWRGWVSYA